MKIGKLLTKLVAELNSKLAEAPFIELANISSLSGGAESPASRSAIILSVINIEENKELKNQTPHQYSPTKTNYQENSSSLVLSLLFTSHTDQSKYADGLDKLDDIIAYFRKNRKLYLQDSNLTQTPPSNGSYNIMVLSMVNQKTDQLSQLWSYLGSKYKPSLLYELQIISFEEENILPVGEIISI